MIICPNLSLANAWRKPYRGFNVLMDNSPIRSVDTEASLSVSLSSLSSSDSLSDSLLNSLSDSSAALASASERYILTQVGARQLVFPAQWVTEILLVERSQILVLPFYAPILLGVFHHHSQIIPLVAIWQVLEGATAPTREMLSVVQLSAAAAGLAGVGIVVDRASDNRLREQFSADLFSSNSTPDTSEPDSSHPSRPQLFHPGLLSNDLWHPQRWRPTNFDRLGSV